MKKLFSSFIVCLIGTMSLFAQTNPNRVLITDKDGNTRGFLAERIDSIWFTKVEGKVAAQIEYIDYLYGKNGNEDSVVINITRTSECQAFQIDCLPKVRADILGNETNLANYMESQGGELLWYDFSEERLHGYDFQSDTEYSIITLGYDKYGIPCGVERLDFKTPKKELVGDCSIEYEVTDVTPYEITIKFTPASGVAGYAACLFGEGQAEEQFQQFGPMFGFVNMGDMIKSFGFKDTGAATYTWENNDPGTNYEIYVQPWDVNGTYADMIEIHVTTKKIGGEGVAEMTIEIGDFGGSESGYYQIVTYTPNDQVSMHRDILIEKNSENAENEDYIKKLLMGDMPGDPEWNQYGVDVASWTADPETEYIAYSMGMNINDEWGPLAKKEFKTPAAPGAAAAKAKTVDGRAARVKKQNSTGKFTIPALVGKSTITPVKKTLKVTE